MLRQLFFSGVVAACNMEVLFTCRQKVAFPGITLSTCVVNRLDAVRFTGNYPNSYR
ncbi:hypothetical protein J2X66_001720 [Pseudomonas sp. 3296]|nr:hypothetical protein [Pseudomonas sp. 3296]